MGTQIKLNIAYHPQAEYGQSEWVDQCIEMFLRCMTGHKPTQWNRWLPLAEWWYNISFHTVIGMTPFKAFYGIDPPIMHYHQEKKSDNHVVEEFVKDREAIQQQLKENLVTAQERMKLC